MDTVMPAGALALNDDQIAVMLINESGVQLNSDVMRQFNVTPRLCAKLLFAICELSRHESLHPQAHGNDDIDALAQICREFIHSASPLADIIKAIDSEEFIKSNNKVIVYENGSNRPFQKFWQFCYNLCNTDKQGKRVIRPIRPIVLQLSYAERRASRRRYPPLSVALSSAPFVISRREGRLVLSSPRHHSLQPLIDVICFVSHAQAFPYWESCFSTNYG